MILLFIGDIVGTEATRHVVACLPALRREHGVDLVVANAENCAPSGFGMSSDHAALLLSAGVDVITGGNHSWDTPDSVSALAHPRVLRPHNLRDGVPGTGLVHVTAGGEAATVLNLSDEEALHGVRAVEGMHFSAYACWLAAERRGAVVVDFHGESVFDKQVFAYSVDGEAAAVLGTHTHEPTGVLSILAGGTGMVTDVGMTGPLGGVQGFAAEPLAAGTRQHDDRFAFGKPPVASGPIVLAAILLEIHDGRTARMERIGHEFPSSVTRSPSATAAS